MLSSALVFVEPQQVEIKKKNCFRKAGQPYQ